MLSLVALVSLLFTVAFAWSSFNDLCNALGSHDARWRHLAALAIFFLGSFCGSVTSLYALLARWL